MAKNQKRSRENHRKEYRFMKKVNFGHGLKRVIKKFVADVYKEQEEQKKLLSTKEFQAIIKLIIKLHKMKYSYKVIQRTIDGQCDKLENHKGNPG